MPSKMKTPPNRFRSLIGTVLLLISTQLLGEALLEGDDLGAQNGVGVRVVVPPADVAIDGEARPQLGSALSDSLIAGLLNRERFVVSDSGELNTLAANVADTTLGERLLERAQADFFLVPRLVGEGDYYHFTVRKIDVRSMEVVHVYQLSHRGDLDEVFGFVPELLEQIDDEVGAAPMIRSDKPYEIDVHKIDKLAAPAVRGAKKSAPPKRVERVSVPEAPKVKPLIVPQVPTFVQEAETRPVKPVVKEVPPASVATVTLPEDIPVAKVVRSTPPRTVRVSKIPVGVVQVVNHQWKFCVVKPYDDAELELWDSLEIMINPEFKTYATMTLTKFEGNKVIANFGEENWNRELFPGDIVYSYQARTE